MANEQQVALLKNGVSSWNGWRQQNPDIEPDLNGAVLNDTDLSGYNLGNANLFEAYLLNANLSGCDMTAANLTGGDLSGCNLQEALLRQAILNDCLMVDADLSGAVLDGADLSGADLRRALCAGTSLVGADLNGVNLCGTIFTNCTLDDANLKSARLNETIFRNSSLRGSKQLQFCDHFGPSSLDHRSISRSGALPEDFLQGCGFPEALISYYRSASAADMNSPAIYISYAGNDESFSRKLHQDLQDRGIRCWLENLDLPAPDRADFGLHPRGKGKEYSVIILSRTSIIDNLFKAELQTMALAERARQEKIMFPVRIDSSTEKSPANWVEFLRTSRGIIDFSQWDYEEAYRSALETLISQLLQLRRSV